VDIKIEAASDISREHFRLRRDEKTGQFFIRDLSSYGTTVNGKRLQSSLEETAGERRDIQREIPLPRKAAIGLADALVLEFEAMEGK
jgi:pSer/pThr/pTyr-binding forkhead associated (FHA) protein